MRFRRRLRSRAIVDLVPMIDVVFQLILFFLVATSFSLIPALHLSLPAAQTAEAVQEGTLAVAIVSRSEIWLNREKLSLEALQSRLAALSAGDRAGIRSVSVEADRDVPYALAVEVLDILRLSGFSDINLRTAGGEKEGGREARNP